MFRHLKGHHQAKILVIKHKKDTRSLFLSTEEIIGVATKGEPFPLHTMNPYIGSRVNSCTPS